MLLVKLQGLIQTSPERGAAPAKAGELWQVNPISGEHLLQDFLGSMKNLFSLKDQTGVNFKVVFLNKCLNLGEPPQLFERWYLLLLFSFPMTCPAVI